MTRRVCERWTTPDGRLRTAVPLIAVLALAALIRLWHLDQNGFGRHYYAAAVRSMLASWHNVFFNAFDPAGFLSLGKPPLAIWWQAAGAKLLGFGAWSILLPQVIAGPVSIGLLYRLVCRSHGPTAAALAALLMALTPVSVAVDRSNNTESLLISVLLAAALLALRAAETGRLRWYAAAMGMIGVGFNVKMGAALVLAPVLAAAYSIAYRAAGWGWHACRHAAAAIVLVAVALSWVIAFDLTPADRRPFAGSTRDNSMLELALVHNGAARYLKLAAVAGDTSGPDAVGAPPTAPQLELTDTSPTGVLRLLRPRRAAQAAWLLPLVLAGLIFVWSERSTDGGEGERRRSAAVILTGWLLAYWVVLSAAGGPVHTYYIAVLAPPLAALAGIGLWGLWVSWRSGMTTPPAALALLASTVAWQTYLGWGQAGSAWGRMLLVPLGAASMLAAASLALGTLRSRSGCAARIAGTCVLASMLALPALATASVVLVRPNVAAPFADIARIAKPDETQRSGVRDGLRDAARTKLVAYLTANRGTATFLLAVPNAVVAAPLIVFTGEPVMAMGGYLGDDPILAAEDLQRLAASGKVRFVMLGGFTLAPGKQSSLAPIEQWVRANGKPVDPDLWRVSRGGAGQPYRIRLGDAVVEVPPPELCDLGTPGR